MSMYHGYRQMWMFGVSEEELMRAHAACFKWCHKPERDAGIKVFFSPDELRESLGLNEPK